MLGFNDAGGDFALGGARVEGIVLGVDIAVKAHGGASCKDHAGDDGEEG